MSRIRPLLAALVLVALAGGLPALASPASVLAATPELTLVTDARYTVDPDAGRIHVAVDIDATNHKKDTTTRRYYFDRAYLAVLPGTTALSVSADGASPTVKVAERNKDYDLLLITFGTKLTSGKSLPIQLRFDLADRGGQVDRNLRVGQSLITFPVWAFGSEDTPGSTVEVVLPAGYHVEFAAGSMQGPSAVGDTVVYRTGQLQHPLDFFAYVVADRQGAYAARSLDIEVGGKPAPVTIRAWSDDPGFAERTGDLFSRGLPLLGTAIGLDYPRDDQLVVQESVSRTLGGYAGLFDPSSGEIRVDYAASPFVVLHEAAHVWFNGSLLADRWANEAFASHYAVRVATQLGIDDAPAPLSPALEAARIPLNAWGDIGQGSEATEDYGYAAAVVLAETVAKRAGEDGLQAVWRAAAARESAYQPRTPAAEPELTDSAPDWRGLLDLLEERTGQRFDDLWTTWVVRPDEADLLLQRSDARSLYRTVGAKADDWDLPRAIRSAMTSWQFDQATGLLGQASEVLDRRADIAAAAAAVGVTPPDTLRAVFEGDRGLPAAHAEALAELAAIDAIEAAAGTEPTAPGPIEALGLMGSKPADDLAASRAAFATGDLVTAVEKADAARSAWTAAGDVGGRRALALLGAALLVSLAIALAIGGWRSRRARLASAPADPTAAGTEARAGAVHVDGDR